MKVTFKLLKKIYKCYNPLGENHYFLVNDFLRWSMRSGDFYWIWDGAEEIAKNLNIYKNNYKGIIKDLPFINNLPDKYSTYKDLLIDSWLTFLNQDENLVKVLIEELRHCDRK